MKSCLQHGGSSAQWLVTVDPQHDGWLRWIFSTMVGYGWIFSTMVVGYGGSSARWLITVDLQHDGWLRWLFNTKVDYGGSPTPSGSHPAWALCQIDVSPSLDVMFLTCIASFSVGLIYCKSRAYIYRRP